MCLGVSVTPDVLRGLLWLARSGLRLEGTAIFAGHGQADANYRPPHLPYVSVTGPLALEVESERDPARRGFLWVRTPGYLAGRTFEPADVVPAPGQLALVVDQIATTTLALDFGPLAGSLLTDVDVGKSTAQVIQSAVDGAAWQEGGVPVLDPARIAELGAVTARYDRSQTRFVLSSGRRGPVEDQNGRTPSAVAVAAVASDLAPALGLDANEGIEGRLARHRLPPATAVAIDLRIDLWASSQLGLSRLMDTWAQMVPTRARMLVQPGLLAADALDGDTTITLLAGGEPATRWTLAQLEAFAGFQDRLSGRTLTLTAGATIGSTVRLTADGTASLPVYEAPPIPYSWLGDHPGPEGFAVSLGLQFDAGSEGDAVRVFTLEHNGLVVLRLSAVFAIVDASLVVTLIGEGVDATGISFGTAEWTLPDTAFASERQVHVVVDARAGRVELFVDGLPQPEPAVGTGPARPAGGHDIQLVLGNADAPNDVGCDLSHVQVHGRPLGPVDPRFRTSLSEASRWSVGDTFVLARSEDGFTTVEEGFAATVIEVSGDTLVLNAPVEGDWLRATTLASKRGLFFFQRQLRRRDDLMNGLFRICLEYRVSAMLHDKFASKTAPLVEITDLVVQDLARLTAEEAAAATDPVSDPIYPLRPATGRAGVRAHITSSHSDGSRS